MLHVRTNAYIKNMEDDLQFCAMLSITLTLFSGLLLKAQQSAEDEDTDGYETGLMVFMLVGINIGVVILCLYQVFLTFRKGPPASQTKLQRKLCLKLFNTVLDRNRDE